MPAAERERERAMFVGVSTGVLLGLSMLVTGVWSQSLTLLADSIRALLSTSLDICVLLVLRRIHRGQLGGFEYGHGKLENFLNLLVATGLVLAAIGLVGLGAMRFVRPPQPPPFGPTVALFITSLNTVQNVLVFALLRRAARDGTSILINGQLRARVSKIAASATATTAILVSLVFQGQTIAVISDLTGMAVVVLVMLWTAFRMTEAALPHLLDRLLDEPQQDAINRALIRHFNAYDELLFVRTRRSGNTMFVDIGLGYEAHRTMGEVDRINQTISEEIKALIPGASVTVTATACAAVVADKPGQPADTGSHSLVE